MGRKPDEIVIIATPWSPEQVANLMRKQADLNEHPYTCEQHSDLSLLPTRIGWVCEVPGCPYRQSWAYVADGGRMPLL